MTMTMKEEKRKALYTLGYVLRSTEAGKNIDYIEVTEEGCGLAAIIHFVPGSGKHNKSVGIDGCGVLQAIINVCEALM